MIFRCRRSSGFVAAGESAANSDGRQRAVQLRGLPAGSLSGDRLERRSRRPRGRTDPQSSSRIGAGATPVDIAGDRGARHRAAFDWPQSPRRSRRSSTLMVWLSIAGGVFLVWLVLVFLFTPGDPLPPVAAHVGQRRRLPLHAPVDLSGGAAPRQPRDDPHRRSGVLSGDARGDPRRHALHQHGVLHLPRRTDRPTQFIEALSERARSGVNVTIVVDAIGSLSLWGRPVARLRAAGCRIQSYQAVRWYSLYRINNRTHRELLVVDGTTAFVGGAGVADWWAFPQAKAGTAVARHDGAHRGPGRRRAAGRGRRELARMLRRDPDRARLLPGPATGTATRRRSWSRARRRIARPRRA